MTIIEERLGSNPLHRMRNRISTKILEKDWEVNYEVNKKNLSRSISFDTLKPRNDVGVIVGAGPSLEENLKDIGLLDASFFCTDKAFPKFPLIPEFVFALNTKSPKRECDGWWKAKDTSQSTLVMPLTSDPAHLDEWKGRVCLINQALPTDLMDQITEETGLDPLPGGSNVGVFSYMMAVRLGIRTAVLIGMDYSFETREEVLSKVRPDESYIIFEHRDALGRVRWASWDWFDSAVAFFEHARYFGRNGVKTINASEGGIIYDGEFIEAKTVKEVADAL